MLSLKTLEQKKLPLTRAPVRGARVCQGLPPETLTLCTRATLLFFLSFFFFFSFVFFFSSLFYAREAREITSILLICQKRNIHQNPAILNSS